MLTFYRALKTNAAKRSDDEDCDYVHEFMSRYRERLRANEFGSKATQMEENLRETLARLLTAVPDATRTKSTYWYGDDVLCFDPSLIDMSRIENEQLDSLVTMHASAHARIKVAIDVEHLSWWEALKMANAASFANIVDGLRLWSTLPYRVDSIVVITTNRAIANQSCRVFLAPKLRGRVHVCDSWQGMCQHLGLPARNRADHSGGT